MRRNSLNNKRISYFWKIVLLGIYQFTTVLYSFLTPLIGVFFCYAILLKKQDKKMRDENTKEWYFIFIYLTFAELNHDFHLFSTILVFVSIYYLLADWMQTSIKCEICILSGFVVLGYVGIYWMNNLFAYITNTDFYYFGWEYIYYIIVDSIIAAILFRGKIS